MYQIQLLFFKLTAKHLGLMPVVHICPSAAQTQVGAPSLVHTLPTLTSGRRILKKSRVRNTYALVMPTLYLWLLTRQIRSYHPPSTWVLTLTQAGPVMGPPSHPWSPPPFSPEHPAHLTLDIHTRGIPQTLLSLPWGWAPRSGPSLGTRTWHPVRSAPPNPPTAAPSVPAHAHSCVTAAAPAQERLSIRPATPELGLTPSGPQNNNKHHTGKGLLSPGLLEA